MDSLVDRPRANVAILFCSISRGFDNHAPTQVLRKPDFADPAQARVELLLRGTFYGPILTEVNDDRHARAYGAP